MNKPKIKFGSDAKSGCRTIKEGSVVICKYEISTDTVTHIHTIHSLGIKCIDDSREAEMIQLIETHHGIKIYNMHFLHVEL